MSALIRNKWKRLAFVTAGASLPLILFAGKRKGEHNVKETSIGMLSLGGAVLGEFIFDFVARERESKDEL